MKDGCRQELRKIFAASGMSDMLDVDRFLQSDQIAKALIANARFGLAHGHAQVREMLVNHRCPC